MKKNIIFNSESAYFYRTNDAFRSNLIGAANFFCDSSSLSLVLRLHRVKHMRFHGPDYMEMILTDFPSSRICIVGGSKHAHLKLKQKFNLSSVLFFDQVIDNNELEKIKETLVGFKPKFTFICLGLLKQEWAMNVIWSEFNDNENFKDSEITGVGAAVDFLGETKTRAGKIWIKIGFEWLPRLFREPRMFPRIVRSMLGCGFVLLQKNRFEEITSKFVKYVG